MKRTSLLSAIAITSLFTATPVVLPAMNIIALQAPAQAQDAAKLIADISKVKGKPGSADLMRKNYKDLQPIGIQPGGAGMVVNLYSQEKNTTLSLCTMFDVVVAVKKGKVAKFAAAEVK